MARSRIPVCIALITVLCAAVAAADMRTKPIRLVHEMTWDAAPTSITVVGKNNSDHEKAEAFFTAVNDWVKKGFEKLDYTVGDGGEVTFEWTLDIYDPGSAAKRWAVGFGAG